MFRGGLSSVTHRPRPSMSGKKWIVIGSLAVLVGVGFTALGLVTSNSIVVSFGPAFVALGLISLVWGIWLRLLA